MSGPFIRSSEMEAQWQICRCGAKLQCCRHATKDITSYDACRNGNKVSNDERGGNKKLVDRYFSLYCTVLVNRPIQKYFSFYDDTQIDLKPSRERSDN